MVKTTNRFIRDILRIPIKYPDKHLYQRLQILMFFLNNVKGKANRDLNDKLPTKAYLNCWNNRSYEIIKKLHKQKK